MRGLHRPLPALTPLQSAPGRSTAYWACRQHEPLHYKPPVSVAKCEVWRKYKALS